MMRGLALLFLLLLAAPAWAQSAPKPVPKPAAGPPPLSPAMQALIAEAQGGDADAAYHLAQDYLTGHGVTIDAAAGFSWMREAAKKGVVPAQLRVGELEERGIGTRPDPADAATWYRLAATRGDARAMYRLGELYRKGLGVNIDPAEAARWYRPAADRGEMPAEVALGRLYRDGEGVPANRDQAARWFQLAARAGSAEGRTQQAQLLLGDDLPHAGPHAPSANARQAISLLEAAAAQGYAPAALRLGQAHLDGVEAELDLQTGARLVRQAAELGDPAAGRVLGQLYADGKALPRDPLRGYAWLDLIAGQGDARAMAARDNLAKDLSADQIKAARALEQQLARAKRAPRENSGGGE